MKRFLLVCLLALPLSAVTQQKASAWCCFSCCHSCCFNFSCGGCCNFSCGCNPCCGGGGCGYGSGYGYGLPGYGGYPGGLDGCAWGGYGMVDNGIPQSPAIAPSAALQHPVSGGCPRQLGWLSARRLLPGTVVLVRQLTVRDDPISLPVEADAPCRPRPLCCSGMAGVPGFSRHCVK